MSNTKRIKLDLDEDEIENIGQYGKKKGPLIKRLIPKSLWLAWNKFAVKYDDQLEWLSDKYKDTFVYPFNPVRWFYSNHLNGFFRHRIPQCWAYIKLAWYDYDWDHSYFIDLMIFKLERMEKVISGYDRHVGVENDCSQMKLVIECLKRFRDDDYKELVDKDLEKLYPEEFKLHKEDPWILDNRNKKVWLNDDGEKRVIYESSPSVSMTSEYKERWFSLLSYYERIKVNDLRVAFHIMTPAWFKNNAAREVKFEELKAYNEKLYKETPDEYDLLCRRIHEGINSWWD